MKLDVEGGADVCRLEGVRKLSNVSQNHAGQSLESSRRRQPITVGKVSLGSCQMSHRTMQASPWNPRDGGSRSPWAKVSLPSKFLGTRIDVANTLARQSAKRITSSGGRSLEHLAKCAARPALSFMRRLVQRRRSRPRYERSWPFIAAALPVYELFGRPPGWLGSTTGKDTACRRKPKPGSTSGSTRTW